MNFSYIMKIWLPCYMYMYYSALNCVLNRLKRRLKKLDTCKYRVTNDFITFATIYDAASFRFQSIPLYINSFKCSLLSFLFW